MRYRERSAALDLSFEEGNNGASRSKHIAEPHGDDARGCLLNAKRLTIQFCDPLARTHDAHWIDGFIGRNKNHGIDIEL